MQIVEQRYLREVSVLKIRIKFAKRDEMKFIGHLDIMRYFQKAMRRAGVDIAYSEGFSPHQKMSFAAPLGLGLTSEGEYMDIELHSSKSSREMIQDLNRTMVDGIEILSFKQLPDSAQNAMSSVEAADYRVTFKKEEIPFEEQKKFFQKIETFLKQEAIPIIKKTKKGEKELDLKLFIYRFCVQENSLFLTVSTGSVENIKPELIIETFFHSENQEMPEFCFQIQRLELYAKDFIPLEDLGEDIE